MRNWYSSSPTTSYTPGAVWLGRAFRGKGYTSEVLYLLLGHCFGSMKCIRVTWKCDDKNEASKRTALAHGAKYEGNYGHC